MDRNNECLMMALPRPLAGPRETIQRLVNPTGDRRIDAVQIVSIEFRIPSRATGAVGDSVGGDGNGGDGDGNDGDGSDGDGDGGGDGGGGGGSGGASLATRVSGI
ncbi:hypothetical protein HZH66_005272 [Vespula vulgaris]|uniref:Uncharacterized protein n=1 Tax=Vespula vulgaris TaxID=7454 RepID=A0A834NAN9_VESVU|nr:hypothetical protein HZH66_005272 [Vespula vulgaris]